MGEGMEGCKGGGDVIQNQTSPDLRFPGVGISDFRPKEVKNHTLWHLTYLYGLLREFPPGIVVQYMIFQDSCCECKT